MKNPIEQPWIEAGYQLFSKEGPAGLKVDQLARAVGISRSSFYHLFADMNIFQEKLLAYHAQRAQQSAEKVKKCRTMNPDYVNVIIEEKDYVLFNRQLRIHRHQAAYKEGFENAIALVGKETMGIWTEMVGLQHKPELARTFFKMTADILFHRMTEENINFNWLVSFMNEMKLFVMEATKTPQPGSKPE